MKKDFLLKNSKEGLATIKALRGGKPKPNGPMIPMITGQDAMDLVAGLRAHDRFRADSLTKNGKKRIG